MWADLTQAVRVLRSRRSFAAATVLTPALGIGVTTAVYSVAFGVLVRPLPVRDEASLVIAYATTSIRDDAPVSFPRFSAWRDSGAFEALAGITVAGFDLTEGVAERVPAAGVTGNFFSVTGGTPQLGRTLEAGDTAAAEVPAVISDTLWRRRFGTDPAILGRSIKAGQQRLTVIGVMVPRFERWRGEAHIWVPLESVHSATVLGSPGSHVVTPVGRLRPGGGVEAARRLAIVDGQLDTVGHLRSRDNRGARIVALRNDVVPARFERLILALFAAGALTWLIVCANVATLLMVRGVEREHELAVRLAVGASRARIIRQLVVESGALASIGGLLGGLLAYLTLRSFVSTAPAGLFDGSAIVFDWPVAAFACGTIVMTTILCGVLPAIRASNLGVHPVSHQRTAAGTRRLSNTLIAAQLAGALVVLVGALLVTKSLARMEQTELGFDGELDDAVSDAAATTRYSSRLLMLSAVLTSILCAAGVYSAFAYAVAARRHEFGIRIALGAQPRMLTSDVLLRAAFVAGLGLAAGVPLALASSTALASLLFEVSPRDPVVATAAAAALALLALVAAWVPARRAAAVDPILALRDVSVGQLVAWRS